MSTSPTPTIRILSLHLTADNGQVCGRTLCFHGENLLESDAEEPSIQRVVGK